jgi:hypothetical protein
MQIIASITGKHIPLRRALSREAKSILLIKTSTSRVHKRNLWLYYAADFRAARFEEVNQFAAIFHPLCSEFSMKSAEVVGK